MNWYVDVVGCVVTPHIILHDITSGCMSSGGFSFSSLKSHSVVDNNRKSGISDNKDHSSDIKNNFEKSDAKLEKLTHTSRNYPGFTSADQLHHYARNFIMVQRYVVHIIIQ